MDEVVGSIPTSSTITPSAHFLLHPLASTKRCNLRYFSKYGGTRRLRSAVTRVLADNAIRTAKPREKPYKMGDSGGLFLLIHPSGARWWRFKWSCPYSAGHAAGCR